MGEHRVVEQGKGSMKMKMSYLSYEWVDGMYVPVDMTIKAMGIKQHFKLTDVTINNEVTPDIVIPASIQAFIDEDPDTEETAESEETAEPETTNLIPTKLSFPQWGAFLFLNSTRVCCRSFSSRARINPSHEAPPTFWRCPCAIRRASSSA